MYDTAFAPLESTRLTHRKGCLLCCSFLVGLSDWPLLVSPFCSLAAHLANLCKRLIYPQNISNRFLSTPIRVGLLLLTGLPLWMTNTIWHSVDISKAMLHLGIQYPASPMSLLVRLSVLIICCSGLMYEVGAAHSMATISWNSANSSSKRASGTLMS